MKAQLSSNRIYYSSAADQSNRYATTPRNTIIAKQGKLAKPGVPSPTPGNFTAKR
jgi:hypothetical protein